ncbi:hypothetical protein JRQ81_009475 [Phrynocephalus forsythii]|uniref:FERM domain-containing protein 8 n=1 Tax=Phrynocephalus forsythii TaxID=171643 RepID=A0A9Q0XBV4_9SAUR|nr:hypothetical protein JRQ81_009475 [Phrynocephalus forsythii]
MNDSGDCGYSKVADPSEEGWVTLVKEDPQTGQWGGGAHAQRLATPHATPQAKFRPFGKGRRRVNEEPISDSEGSDVKNQRGAGLWVGLFRGSFQTGQEVGRREELLVVCVRVPLSLSLYGPLARTTAFVAAQCLAPARAGRSKEPRRLFIAIMDECSQRSSISSTGHRTQDVLVYLVDDTIVRLTVDNLPLVTARELHRIVLETLRLPEYGLEVFSLWLVSPFLELQLKPKHQPYKLCRQWQDLLFRFTSCSGEEILEDEPSLQFRRDIFFSRRKELQIHDEDVLRLLYEEAKHNILEGRYPCDLADCEVLGALVCRVNLGLFDPEQHTTCFLKERLDTFLPSYLCRRGHRFLSGLWKRGATQPPADEQGLLHAYQTISKEEDDGAGEEHAALCKLYHTYLQKCHELPYYGCAFFSGEIDKPAQGLLHRSGRKAVTVAISLEGVYVIDSKEKHVLLGLHFQELSWDHTFPSEEEHILWLEFDGENEGTPVNKLLKIYSKQAELMSSLIEYCIELNTIAEEMNQDVAARPTPTSEPPCHRQHPKLQRQESVLCSRIQRLSTIDYVEDGKKIKRVKPRRTTSFFGHQLSNVPTSYSTVQAAENLEQG